MRTRTSSKALEQLGFSLLELMVVLVVVAILATIAYPSFIEQVRKSRRGDAITALSSITQAEERWRSNSATYTTDLSASGLNIPNPASGYYTLSVSTVSASAATRYVATATAAGAQASDTRCTSLSITVDGGSITYAATPAANSNLCWNR